MALNMFLLLLYNYFYFKMRSPEDEKLPTGQDAFNMQMRQRKGTSLLTL